jgi:hypothetical protein
MRSFAITTAAAASFLMLSAGGALAQCQERLDAITAQLPDFSAMTTEEAVAQTGMTEEQIEALLATLDAARLAAAAEEDGSCEVMAGVAEDMVERAEL